MLQLPIRSEVEIRQFIVQFCNHSCSLFSFAIPFLLEIIINLWLAIVFGLHVKFSWSRAIITICYHRENGKKFYTCFPVDQQVWISRSFVQLRSLKCSIWAIEMPLPVDHTYILRIRPLMKPHYEHVPTSWVFVMLPDFSLEVLKTVLCSHMSPVNVLHSSAAHPINLLYTYYLDDILVWFHRPNILHKF